MDRASSWTPSRSGQGSWAEPGLKPKGSSYTEMDRASSWTPSRSGRGSWAEPGLKPKGSSYTEKLRARLYQIAQITAGRDGLPGRPQGLNFLATPNLDYGAPGTPRRRRAQCRWAAADGAPIGHALPGTGSSGDCGAGRDGLPGRPRGLKFLSTPNLDFSAPIGHALPENLQRRQSRSGVSPLSPHLNDQLCTPVREPLSKRSV